MLNLCCMVRSSLVPVISLDGRALRDLRFLNEPMIPNLSRSSLCERARAERNNFLPNAHSCTPRGGALFRAPVSYGPL
jgi:hypothetical protein